MQGESVNQTKARSLEYAELIRGTLRNPSIQKLSNYTQHLGTNRLQHSINVSYMAFVIAKKLKWDYIAVARAGLMHDMFYYEYKESGLTAREHCKLHPQIALRNAARNFALSELESDIISSHMWIAVWTLPKYKEAYLVTLIDKYCALEEVILSLLHMRSTRADTVMAYA